MLELAGQIDREARKAPTITLTEVVAVKMCVDVYVQKKANEHLERLSKKEE